MKITKKVFEIELTEDEIGIIVRALHVDIKAQAEEVKRLKQSHDACDHAEWPKIEKIVMEEMDLRNALGRLINVAYMGE